MQDAGCTMHDITKRQIKKIHTLTSKLKMSDDEYRLLLSDWWVSTSKDLKYHEAEELIKKLEEKAIPAGVWSRYSMRGKMRYEHLGKREGMASPKQLRMIESLWKDASFTHDAAKRQVALRRFVFRIAGVDDLPFLTNEGARKVIKAIQSIKHKHGPVREHGVYKDRSAYGS